jgi:hypothetical protein
MEPLCNPTLGSAWVFLARRFLVFERLPLLVNADLAAESPRPRCFNSARQNGARRRMAELQTPPQLRERLPAILRQPKHGPIIAKDQPEEGMRERRIGGRAPAEPAA